MQSFPPREQQGTMSSPVGPAMAQGWTYPCTATSQVPAGYPPQQNQPAVPQTSLYSPPASSFLNSGGPCQNTSAGPDRPVRVNPGGDGPFTCNVCSKTFNQKRNLKTHIRSHTGHKPFVCEVCSKAFSQRRNLKEHMSTHSGQKAFQCDVCGKAFTLKNNLKTHRKTHNAGR